MKYRVERDGNSFEIDVMPSPDGYVLRGPDGEPQLVKLQTRADGSQRAITPWGELEIVSARRGGEVWAQVDGRPLSARVERARPAGAAGNTGGAGTVRAPMAGKLLRLDVRVGDELKAGQAVAVIEAMKMENELVAPLDGVVIEVGPAPPCTLDKGALIVKLEPR
jgi:3-methylcrotonyl-CoA carboxylase alpha subunit